MVKNYGDRWWLVRGCGTPDPNGLTTSWLVNGGDPNYFLTGMILQVSHEAHDSLNKTALLHPFLSFFGEDHGKTADFQNGWWCPLSKKWVGDLFYISVSKLKIWRTESSLNAGHTWSYQVVENQHIFTKVPGALLANLNQMSLLRPNGQMPLPLRIMVTLVIKWMTRWWLQPIWKILVKLDHFPR